MTQKRNNERKECNKEEAVALEKAFEEVAVTSEAAPSTSNVPPLESVNVKGQGDETDVVLDELNV